MKILAVEPSTEDLARLLRANFLVNIGIFLLTGVVIYILLSRDDSKMFKTIKKLFRNDRIADIIIGVVVVLFIINTLVPVVDHTYEPNHTINGIMATIGGSAAAYAFASRRSAKQHYEKEGNGGVSE